MYSRKIQHPANFRFAERLEQGQLRFGREQVGLRVTEYQGDVFRLELAARRWPRRESQAELTHPEPANRRRGVERSGRVSCEIDRRAALRLTLGREVLLHGESARSIGISGCSWLVNLVPHRDYRFFGLGGKWGPFEKSGLKTYCWNTDVWAESEPEAVHAGRIDPSYTNLPYLIIQRGRTHVGVLVDNPYAVFFSLQASFDITGRKLGESPARDSLFFGADAGRPIIYFIVGPSLAELTRKLQCLVGTTPRPPLWALGHHQSRWGYASYAELAQLEDQFRQHATPNDGLWLDIDYMDSFKVFTFDRRMFSSPKKQLASLHERGQRVVPILDPGVKRQSGYAVYEQGRKAGHFCLNPEGYPFVGFVWPGQTHFPDFSLAGARDWWAARVAKFARAGFDGFWIDMNDPSTGAARPADMLFALGKREHASYHNQYALGMARATHDGLRRARPDERPFVLSRSAFVSTSRVSAVWTGDNVSNAAHLASSIPISLNLALSGIPFNGPDVPGFGGDADDDLMTRWYKAAFLFPFLRNHSCTGTRRQEPWAFSKATLRVVRRFIRLRYKLLPYLYNSFVDQEQRGEAIMRPLGYDFPDAPELGAIDDQFMIGPALLHAPCLGRDASQRSVVLPAGHWYDMQCARWIKGDRRIRAKDELESTPLFVRDGSVLPLQPGVRRTNENQLGQIELHVFSRTDASLHRRNAGESAPRRFSYEFDDGKSLAYRRGVATRVEFELTRRGQTLHVQVVSSHAGYEPLRVRFVTYGSEEALVVHFAGEYRKLPLREHRWKAFGVPLQARRSSWYALSPSTSPAPLRVVRGAVRPRR